MKKFLILLILSMVLACAQEETVYTPINDTGGETVADGLKWYDVVTSYYVMESGGTGGTSIQIDNKIIEPDLSGHDALAMIEFDDDKDYVGAERGRIIDGNQPYVYNFHVWVNEGYTIKVVKGEGITEDQFEEAVDPYHHEEEIYWEGAVGQSVAFYAFRFHNMTGKENIDIDTVLAELVVYKNNDLTKSLGSFFIVL